MNYFTMQSQYKGTAATLRIPQFFLRIESNLPSLSKVRFLTKAVLLDGFTLSDKNTELDLETVAAKTSVVDEDAVDVPLKYKRSGVLQSDVFREYFNALKPEGKLRICKDMIFQQLNKQVTVSPSDLRSYIDRMIARMSKDELAALENSITGCAGKIKYKIMALEDEYCERRFRQLFESGDIICQPNYDLAGIISPRNSVSSFEKSLYEAEEDINGFNYDVITAVSKLKNVQWWHRIIEQDDFYLNGYINHYPDFMVMTKKGTMVLIETKRELPNDGSRQMTLGSVWQHQLGQNYQYFMVSRQAGPLPDGIYRIDDLVQLMKLL